MIKIHAYKYMKKTRIQMYALFFLHTFVCGFLSYICMRFCTRVFVIHLYACFFSYICMRVFFIYLYVCLYACFLIHLNVCVFYSYIFVFVFGWAVAQWWVWSSNNQRIVSSIPTHRSKKGLVGWQLEGWQLTSSQLRCPWERQCTPIIPGRCNWLPTTPVYEGFFHTFVCVLF